MTTNKKINICIIQPVGYIHSLGFLDQARYYRYYFRLNGYSVSIVKNRLKIKEINIVLGAHLGFDFSLAAQFQCIFVNLEQLGPTGKNIEKSYHEILQSSFVIDYDENNARYYRGSKNSVHVIPLLYAPYLSNNNPIPMESRPIDLLFYGSINKDRKYLFERIEKLGISVSQFDRPMYGPERDEFIRQSKAVLNTPFYESKIFEQSRVFHALSLGTSVVSNAIGKENAPIPYGDSVFWFDENQLELFFLDNFLSPGYFKEAAYKLDGFKNFQANNEFSNLLGKIESHFGLMKIDLVASPPKKINIGSGKDYKLGWLNLDVQPHLSPDLLFDLTKKTIFPINYSSPTFGEISICEDSIDIINVNNVLEHISDLIQFMTNCLALLRLGGRMYIEVPYEKSLTAWQDPSHVRAMNENSWVYYTDWFWYLDWFDYKFNISEFKFLDLQLKPCSKESAAFMCLILEKVQTTFSEKMTARNFQSNVRLPEDL